MEVDQGLADYYRAMIPKSVDQNKPRWPAHVTVVRCEKEEPVNKDMWLKHNGAAVDFWYDGTVHHGTMYYWLNIYCTFLERVRTELGLPIHSVYTLPPEVTEAGFKKTFHCTIANMKLPNEHDNRGC